MGQVKNRRGFWVDKNENMWHSDLYTEEEASEASDSLLNCKGCVNCQNLTNCFYCTNCEDCVGCYGCVDCFGCVDSEDCVGCYDCKDCTLCADCDDCKECKECIECTKCQDCEGAKQFTGKEGLKRGLNMGGDMEIAKKVKIRIKVKESMVKKEGRGTKPRKKGEKGQKGFRWD